MAKVKDNPYNYLYDKTSKLSSSINHDKALYRAKIFATVYKSQPIFQNMFSDLQAYPNSKVSTKHQSVIPSWFLRDYVTYMKDVNSYLLRYTGIGCNPENLKDMIPEIFKRAPNPIGIDRYLYFYAPVLPKSLILPPDVMLKSEQYKRAYYMKKKKVEMQMTRTVGTQTMYRDGSAQTDPYSPDFVLRPGAEPEILMLIPLSYRNGLPVGLHEVKMIERARHHREVEKKYPSLTDIAGVRKRRAALNKLEIEEWRIRDEQIDELQMARLNAIMKLMKERKENLETVHCESLERICIDRVKYRDEKIAIVRYEYVKAMRKLLKARRVLKDKELGNCLIDQYNNPASNTWAPLARIGQFLDKGSQRYVVNNKYVTTFNGLEDLEDSLPPFVLNPHIKIPKMKNYTNDGYKNKKFRLEEELTELYKYLKTKNQIILAEKLKPLKFLTKNEKIITRPPTPSMDFQISQDADIELAVTFLKQLIKGRAIQVMMFEGKEKRIQLINEIKSTHALYKEEIEIRKREKSIVLSHQRNQMFFERKESEINEAIENLEGQSLGDMCDFLGKELIRLQEERRLHAFAMMAIRERRMREAEESGLRQLEERRRREEDEIFKQIVKVNQTTVESYLECLISENIDITADEVARKDIEIMANEINTMAYESEAHRDYLRTEEIVSDLVHHFLIPEVYKTQARERIALNQRRYLVQAHREILNATDVVVNNFKPGEEPFQGKLKSDASTDPPVEEQEDEN